MRRAFAIVIAAVLLASAAHAVDLPARKPGLWEIKMTFEGRKMPPQVAQHCIDAETDRQMSAIGNSMQGEACSKRDVTSAGGTIVIDSICNFGGATTMTHGVVSGDFNSAYTVKTESWREGGAALPGRKPGEPTRMTVAAKWLGACKQGQKPGDIIMQNGMKMNVIDMQKKAGAPKN
jgi:hypothetical protein